MGLSLSGNLFLVVLFFILGAIGFGMFHAVSFSLVAKSSDQSNMGKNMGDFTSIGDIGRVCIPPLASFVGDFYQGHYACNTIYVFGNFPQVPLQ